MDPKDLSERSWLVSGGRAEDAGAPLNVPIVPASNFLHGGDRGYVRNHGSPTWAALEELVGGLEGGRAVAFSSGMAAVAAVFDRLPVGAVVAIPTDGYHGSVTLAQEGERAGRWTVERLAVDDVDGWRTAAGRADLLWLESPSNPLLVVADLPAICGAPRKPGCVVAIDNTFATPLLQKPLDLGADVVVHSATKAIGGHSDLLCGIAVTRDDALFDGLAERRRITGATPGVLESFLATRGARTLALRMETAQRNAMTLATRLAEHDRVEVVRYPGLASHPTHALAARDLAGFGSMLSFDVAGGAEPADAACRSVRLIHHATSLGGVETTMERRGMHHGQEHLPAGLVRLSVGCEDVEDLWRDLDGALRGA